MARRKTGKASKAKTRITRRKTDMAPRAAVRKTRRKTDTASRSTVGQPRNKTGEASVTACQTIRRKADEPPRAAARVTRSKINQALKAASRMTKSESDEASVAAAQMTWPTTDKTSGTAARTTKHKVDEPGRSAAESCATDTTGNSRRKSTERLPYLGYKHAKASYSAESVSVVDPTNVTASHVADINVNALGDKSHCGISGSAVISADKLLLADTHTKRVKLVDTCTHTLLSVLQLPSRPWDIAVINTNQVAVTLPDSMKILLLGVADTLTSQREISVEGKCHGVAYSQDRLVVTYALSKRVDIMDLCGNVITTIETASDGSKLFGCPRHACVSRDAETIYVTDVYCSPVASLTFNGVVKSVYKDNELRFPQKVCTDHHGHVFVCGYDSTNVHMITEDCRKIKLILTRTDGLDLYPWSVSHCQDTNRLFIGSLNNTTVKVFQLSEKQETPQLV